MIPSQLRPITEEELSVPQSDLEPKVGKGFRTIKEEWKELLAFPSDEVVEKTLKSTTQMQVGPIESERREIPKQHKKKRLLMLHPRCLNGRMDTDTFFSTVKSIHGYLCKQIFCHVQSDYLFVRCMQRESHSHRAYQDYIRKVGDSKLIVTDNSRTQTGKKWETTSREVMTKQRKFVPHNRNKSKVKHRIQDVKHKTSTLVLLQKAKGPLEFWCHALIFMVDCLNHIAKKPLGWRFKFWQSIKFFNKAQFPESRWTMGRFIGIAWDTGDLFTFKVWSEPNGDWKKGHKFIQNIVRTRDESELSTGNQEEPDLSQFCFQKQYKTNKQKRNKEFVYELRDIPEGKEEAEDTTKDNSGEEVNVEPGRPGIKSQKESDKP